MSCYQFEDTRYVRGRHFSECGDAEDCSGCLRCPENHCGECRKGTHLGFGEATCAECIGKARATLRSLLDLYAALPYEAEHRGALSEAANLHGPATDAEAWSYRKAARSLRLGVPMSSLEEDDPDHPVFVLGGWIHALGEDYADRPDRQLTLSEAVDWLDRRLGRIANDAGQDFGQFKREVEHCRTHMEAVLHDQAMGDAANIGCFECGAGLERRLTDRGFEDHWTCKGCRRRYTYAEYNFALRAALEASA
jgi:predicted nucleic acid-binding Zn ribbon protein